MPVIILRNIDGTVGAAEPRRGAPAKYEMVDEELTPDPARTVEGFFSRELPPLYVRTYVRSRRIYPDPRVGPAAGESAVYLYEERTSPDSMAADQIPVRLLQVEAEIGRLGGVAWPLREAAARSGALRADQLNPGTLTVARDAWLSGRLADARAILRQAMTDEQALATVQQWTAEEWRRTAESGAA